MQKKRVHREETTKNENEIAIRPKIREQKKNSENEEWRKHNWTELKILMVRLHILQAMHGCRYSLAKHMQLLFYAYSSFIHSLCRRVFFPSFRSLLSGSYYNSMLVYFFSSFSVFVSFTFYALDSFFGRLFARNVYSFFSTSFFYETAFISRFRYRFPRKISHFPSNGVCTHSQSHPQTEI